MPTPSSDTRPTVAGSPPDQGDTLQFRAPTLEEAIALAESSLGARVRVVAANRIRRGGIGGFFAADLGVEVTVALDDETMEQALARLVADSLATSGSPSSGGSNAAVGGAGTAAATSAHEERMRFEERLAAQEAAAADRSPTHEPVEVTLPPASTGATVDPVSLLGGRFDRRDDEAAAASPAPTVHPVLAEVVAAIVAEAATKQSLTAAAADEPTDEPTDEQPVVDPGPSVHEIAQQLIAQHALTQQPAQVQPSAHQSVRPAAGVADDAESSGVPLAVGSPPVSSPPVAPVTSVEPPVRIVAPDLGDEPGTRPVYTTPPTMLRVEQIMAELSAITAEPVFGERSRARVARPAGRTRVDAPAAASTGVDPHVVERDEAAIAAVADRTADVAHATDATDALDDRSTSTSAPAAAPVDAPRIPTLPPRPSDVARRASDAAHAARARFLANQPPDLIDASADEPTGSAAIAAGPAPRSGAPNRLPTLAAAPVPVPSAARAAVASMPTVEPWPATTTPVADETEATDATDAMHIASAPDATDVVGATEVHVPPTATPSTPRPAVAPAGAGSVARRDDDGVLRVEAFIDDLDDLADLADLDDRLDLDDLDDRSADAAAAPSQRQVELAVAATDQLIESLKREDGLKRLSVRVVLRTGDRREVEAEAEWEAS